MSLEKQLAAYGRLQEELFGAIELDEITNPLTAARQERTPSSQTLFPQRIAWRTRYAGPAWAVAAFVSVLAVGAVYLLFSNSGDQVADNPPPTTVAPEVETMTDLQIIEAGVAALYSGDAERAVELFETEDGDDEAQMSDDDLIRQEAAYQAAIGGRLILNCNEDVNVPGVFTCNVPYHNALTDAVGYVDLPGDFIRVVVQDGVITHFGPHHLNQGVVAYEFPEHSFLLASVLEFLDSTLGSVPGCESRFDTHTAGCAKSMLEHLDEWAAWYETNG